MGHAEGETFGSGKRGNTLNPSIKALKKAEYARNFLDEEGMGELHWYARQGRYRAVEGLLKDEDLDYGLRTDGSDPQTVDTARIIGNAAPETLAALLPEASGAKLNDAYGHRQRSISLFALTLGLSKPPREFGVSSYSTQLLPGWMTKLAGYAQATTLMADEPGERMPPLAIVDYAAIDSGVPTPPYVLSVVGPDTLSNWDDGDQDAYRAKRARWQ